MLVLSRKKNESILIKVGAEVIRVMLVELRGDKVRIGCEAAKHVQIDREEVFEAKQRDLAAMAAAT